MIYRPLVEMPPFCDTGEIIVSGDVVHWRIEDFVNLPQDVDTVLLSQFFRLHDAVLLLHLAPNGLKNRNTEGWFGMGILNCSDPVEFRVRLGVIGDHGQEILSSRAEWDDNYYYAGKLIPWYEFQCQKERMTHDGTLQIFCEVRRMSEDPRTASLTQAEACSDKNESEKDKPDHSAPVEVSSQRETELGANLTEKVNPDHSTCVEASVQTEADLGKLQQDLEDLLLSGRNSDLTLDVKGKEFKVHKNILGARSPVFLAMTEHEMIEKATGVVSIEDGDPDTLPDFLQYLYTGRVKNLNSDSVLSVYTAADKYQVTELKKMCTKYMMENFSIESFCDFLSLSLRHHETGLTDVATRYFLQNPEEIILTPKWQIFLSENVVAGNELFVKALRIKKQ